MTKESTISLFKGYEISPHVRRVTTVHNSQRTDVSLGIGMDKENMTYLYNGTVFSAKGEVLSFEAM